MKKPTLPCLLLALSAVPLAAGPASADEPEGGLARGRVELSTGLSFSNQAVGGEDESTTVLNLPVRAGVLLTDSLALEGELLATHIDYGGEDGQTGVLFSANLVYHFNREGRTSPFLLAGGGVGNGLEFLNLAADAGQTVGVFQAGVGLKSFVGRRAAWRVEYRFTRYSVGNDSPDTAGFEDGATRVHKVMVGISLFFR
jgi:opacity protein-like surface antigen